ERKHDEERGHTAPERQLGEQTSTEAALAEQARLEQWAAAALTEAELMGNEDAEDHWRSCQAHPAPFGKALLATFYQRQQDGNQARRDQKCAEQVDART